ncbi:esterase/lipase family protein [Streptomyces sp. NPDC002004]
MRERVPQHRAGRQRRSLATVMAGTAAAIGLAVSGTAATSASAAEETQGPPQQDIVPAVLYSVAHPNAVPPGADDWSCTPSAAHPRPVILVHGTFENRYDNWAGLSPKLKDAGYCVYALNYGGQDGVFIQGSGDMAASARQLADFVDKVRTATGSAKVDLVGHSQGGTMPRYYIKNLGGAAKVDHFVALTPINHGTTLDGLALLAKFIPGAEQLIGSACPSCRQQIVGSDFLEQLNAGGETDPGVTYTVVATTRDEVVTPYTSAFLAAAPNVTNETLQDYCPSAGTEHTEISYSRPATRLVLNALDPDHARQPDC